MSNPNTLPRQFVRSQSDKIVQSQQLVETRKIAQCVDTTNKRLKVDIEDASGQGLATEAKQDDMIALLEGETPALNRTQAIPVQLMVGHTGSNYDALRANGQDLMVMVDDVNPDVAVNSGLSTKALQEDLNGALASAGTDQIRVDIVSGASTGDATAANQTTMISSLSTIESDTTSIDGKTPALGQAVMASSVPVAIASNQSAVSVDGSGVTQPISAASLPLPSGAATEATLANAEGHLGTIDTSTAAAAASHYADGDSVGASDTGILVMGRNGTNAARPIHITNNGDVEVEIADFVKGAATSANSFPVVLASDQATLPVEEEHSFGAELTIMSSQSIAGGGNATTSAAQLTAVNMDGPNPTFTIDTECEDYTVGISLSHDDSTYFDGRNELSNESGSIMVSLSDFSAPTAEYTKIVIINNEVDAATFTVKTTCLGATMSAP